MAVTTADSFVELLEKSGLLSAEQLAEAQSLAGDCADAKALARALVQKDLISRWQAGKLLAGRSGTREFFLGKYKLIELLGRGGMGAVFLARHTMMNRPVALKVVSKQIAKDPAALDRFLTEARAIAALDDPNIVQAYNVDSEDGQYYIVMEYVEGKDLERIVAEEGPLDFERAADYIRQAADGLAHAHGRDMVHCDVKPSNLLLSSQGVIKILDMGMARLGSKNGEDNGGDGRVLGTVDYLAPEQALESPNLDHRADIYSLGCTLYYLLTGRPPFAEGSLHERILKHQTQEPPPIAQLRAGAPKDLVAICRKMMAKKPEERFQSAGEVSKLLADWRPPKPKLRKAVALEETPASAAAPGVEVAVDGSDSAVTRLARPTTRRLPPWMIIAGAAGAVVLAGLAVVAAVLLSSKSPAETGPRESAQHQVPSHSKTDPEEDVFAAKPTYVEGYGPAKPEEKPQPKPEEKPKPQPKPEEKPQPKPEEKPQPKPEEKPQPKPEEKPQPKPEEKPQPKPEEKPQPKPSPKTEPKPDPKSTDPFRDLPAAVDLPVLDEKAEAPKEAGPPLLIGHVRAADDAIWDLTLIGGDKALKGTKQFLPLVKGQGQGGPDWTVTLETTARGQAPVKSPVARFWRDKTAVHFQWLAGAEPSAANCLRNCVLEVYLGGKTHPVMLCTPLQVPPIEFDVTKGQSRSTATIPGIPDIERVRLEITGFEGHKTFEVEPKEPSTPKTPINLYLTRMDTANNSVRAVTLKITVRPVREGLGFEVRLMDPKPKDVRSLPPPASRDMAANKSNELKRKLAADKDHKIKPDERSKTLREIDTLDGGVALYDMLKALEAGGGKIHYRLFIEAGRHKIELAKTK